MNEKLQIAIYLFVGIVCTLLAIHLIQSQKQYSCDKCVVEFKSYAPITNDERILRVNITEIFESYNQNQCIVFWDKNRGYMKR